MRASSPGDGGGEGTGVGVPQFGRSFRSQARTVSRFENVRSPREGVPSPSEGRVGRSCGSGGGLIPLGCVGEPSRPPPHSVIACAMPPPPRRGRSAFAWQRCSHAMIPSPTANVSTLPSPLGEKVPVGRMRGRGRRHGSSSDWHERPTQFFRNAVVCHTPLIRPLRGPFSPRGEGRVEASRLELEDTRRTPFSLALGEVGSRRLTEGGRDARPFA